ncbi:MAG: 2,3-diphosphoglycerate synthetase [Actinobacteria bacterium]|nr:2,3-diphosphoglycerate synthetase [Actinomycetota bacterium]
MLVDGEHYPPVVAAAVARLGGGHSVEGGIFAGGTEKLRGGEAEGLAALAAEIGVPRLDAVEPRSASPHEVLEGVRAALRAARADVLVDLSDEPVVGYRERFLLMSAALAEGAAYVASDTEVRPQAFSRLEATPALGVIGTGKRVGKTAVSGWLTRRLDAALRADGGVVVLAMGRGGPPEPELIHGERLGPQDLLAASRAGRHAASDCYEDAVLAGVTAVGCRRCGGGLAGMPFDDNVREALPLLDGRGAALAVIEGSGAVVPPVLADAALCVAGAGQPADYVAGFLGTYRLLLSDALVLTQCEPPFAEPGDVRALAAAARAVRPGLEVVPTVFRPRPAQPVRGRRVAFFTTAPESAAPTLSSALEEDHGAEVVLVSCDLADRRRLRGAVDRAATLAEVFLTEIKAAAVDVVAEGAEASGRELVFCDNEPVALDGDLGATVDRVAALAADRFAARAAGDPAADVEAGRP